MVKHIRLVFDDAVMAELEKVKKAKGWRWEDFLTSHLDKPINDKD